MIGMSPNAPSHIVPTRGTYQRRPVIVVWLLKLLSANKSQVLMYTLDVTKLLEMRDRGRSLRSLEGWRNQFEFLFHLYWLDPQV